MSGHLRGARGRGGTGALLVLGVAALTLSAGAAQAQQTAFVSFEREVRAAASPGGYAPLTDVRSTTLAGPWEASVFAFGTPWAGYGANWGFADYVGDAGARRVTGSGNAGGVDNVAIGGVGWGGGEYRMTLRARVEPGAGWFMRLRFRSSGFSALESSAEFTLHPAGQPAASFIGNVAFTGEQNATDWSIPLAPGEYDLRLRLESRTGGSATSQTSDRYEFDFELTTEPGCRVDYTRDGELTFEDVLGFVQAFNMTGPLAGPRGCAPGADLNADGERTFDDVQVFVTLYSQGC